MSQRSSLSIAEGFGARVWLTPAEWDTYRRRVAVRYTGSRRPAVLERDGEMCSVCGESASEGATLQLAHRVPFKLGVVDWGLTPDWLDSVENRCFTHRVGCNDRAELLTSDIPSHLRKLGHRLEDSPAVSAGFVVVTPTVDGDRVEFRFNV